ncbi:RpiB/LacA/LacB family sugar-phosphate isomerase [Egicoccus sp. AB-alg6-2]|uniref:RpiB/LacA/LacB family sugar-phosphate isomerase n=1 Tax=Egicoccus sp. AB-alg6-2 TaxID=3242692 RepID=UPI00359E9476
MHIAIAADHNGIEFKSDLTAWLQAEGHTVDDHGGHDASPVDYPPLCQAVARRILDGTADRGIFIGGTGSGEHIAFNKMAGIRAGLGQDPLTTEISRAHNDANVLVLGAKVVSLERARDLVALWLATPFKGGRHQRRLDQIAALERGETLPVSDTS